MNSWRNLVVGGTLCLGSLLACDDSSSPKAKPPTHEGGAPGVAGQGQTDAGEAPAAGGADATGAGGVGEVGGSPDIIGMGGGSSEPGSWDTSFWDDAVWQ